MLMAQNRHSGRYLRITKTMLCTALSFAAISPAFAEIEQTIQCDWDALAAVLDRDRQPNFIPVTDYPLRCSSSATEQEDVVLKFDVKKNGKAVNVEATSWTNNCFVSSAMRAAKSWEYTCVGDGLSGVETRISYHFRDKKTSLAAASYDAEECSQPTTGLEYSVPVSRMPPEYPARCMNQASQHEEVQVIYDILPSGDTDNIRVSKTTNECLNSAAVASVARWKYKCTSDGKLNLETMITFRLEGEGETQPTHKGVVACYIFDRSKHETADIIKNPSFGQACENDPHYVWQCSQKAGRKEFVVLSFDVTAGGSVHEITVDKSTNACFDDFAKMALSQKEYAQSSTGYENIGAIFVYEKQKLDD